jgi:hypothetical protein
MADSVQQDIDELARKDEAQYVHQVYETIASHFSSTRYKVSFKRSAAQTLPRSHVLTHIAVILSYLHATCE